MAKKHEWVQGRITQIGVATVYFQKCKHCHVQFGVSKEEWEALPTDDSEA